MASKSASISRLKKNTIPRSCVMDLNCLTKKYIEVVSNHSSTCAGKCSITREKGLPQSWRKLVVSARRLGQIESSPIIKGSAEIESRFSVNVGAVWGQM